MKFENKNFAVLVYANGFTGWLYRSKEPITKIIADGYFAPVETLLNVGDTMTIVASDTSDVYYVSSLNPVSLKKLGA